MPSPKFSMKALCAAAVFAAAIPASANTPVPELLKRALSPSGSTQLFAYDFDDFMDDRDGQRTVRGRIDPSRPRGDRVTITYFEDLRKKPLDTAQIDKRFEKDADGDIFCDTASRDDVANVVDKGATEDGARIFTFAPIPEPNEDPERRDLMKNMTAEAIVDEASGVLRSFTANLVKPRTMMVVAKVKSATFTADCAQLPNGRAYTTRTDFKAIATAMGKTYTQTNTLTISNVTPVG
jgi:hypothetical protein